MSNPATPDDTYTIGELKTIALKARDNLEAKKKSLAFQLEQTEIALKTCYEQMRALNDMPNTIRLSDPAQKA